jgi:signal transduction histidine kinase|tara:strand:- start:1096 stop:1383 length:288 start_codon:yes stop_codon:yes gene_type:complete
VNLGTKEVRVAARILFSEGPYVVLSVEDDGSGIAPEDLDMVFQPFFSSKEASQRMTGLGMSGVRAIVRQHNGSIDVASNAEQGTRFEIYIPVTRG